MTFLHFGSFLLYAFSGVNTFLALAGYPESIEAFNAAMAVFTFGCGNLLSAYVARS